MPAIYDPTPSARSAPSARRPRRRIDPVLLAWPLGLLALVIVLAAWRWQDAPARDAGAGRGATNPAAAVTTGTRSFGDVRLEVPSSWQTLSRSRDHVTWGQADRSHTVTVASIEASVLPLPGVVDASIEETSQQLPQARVVEQPRVLELREQYASRDDSAMLVRFAATDASGARLHVTQVWRRDARAGQDLVATWTSADGTWPVDPARTLPHTAGAR